MASVLKDAAKGGLKIFPRSRPEIDIKQRIIRKTLTKIGAEAVPEKLLLKPLVKTARESLAQGAAPKRKA